MIEPGDLETRAPFDGESLYGYVADITGMNKLNRVAMIAGVADRLQGHRPQLATTGWEDLPALAAILGVDVAELQLRSYPPSADNGARRAFFGTTVAWADLTTRVRRFSPAALAKSPFHRAMWQLRIPFDVDTGELLVSTCPLCRATQRWRHSAGVTFCDKCGESLQQPTDKLAEELLPVLKHAIGLTHTDPFRRASSLTMLPTQIADLGAAGAYELLLRLVPVANPACVWTGSDRIWNNDPHAIAVGMHNAWEILVGWPDTFVTRLTADLAKANARFSDGNGGATARFLKLRKATYVDRALRDVIDDLHTSIDTEGPRSLILLDETMTGKEVAKYLRLGTSEVVALRRLGALRTVGVARGSILLPAFDRREVWDIERDRKRRLDLNRVNVRLGLPYYAVEQLSALGHVPLLEHPFFAAKYAEPQTTVDAVDGLVAHLVCDRVTKLRGGLPILAAMQAVGGRLKPWDAVLEAMIRRDLPYGVEEGSQPLFRRITVMPGDISPLLSLPIARDEAITPLMSSICNAFPFDDMMTKLDAAEVLNLGPREITSLLSEYPTTPDPVVPISRILDLASRFITNVEIAQRLGVHYQRVRFATASVGITRTSEAGYERTREDEIFSVVKARSVSK